MSKVEEKINNLGLILPISVKPIAAYIPAIRHGNLVFTSGQLPIKDGSLIISGRLGSSLDIADVKTAAEICLLNALSAIKEVIGDLDQIKNIVRVVGYVACTPEFTNHPVVVNGVSNLILEIFGENGRHARSAVGVSSLPLNSPLEIELTVAV
jgi:enamine deaminase RidA (YjgF/YER057c/UK114 family)